MPVFLYVSDLFYLFRYACVNTCSHKKCLLLLTVIYRFGKVLWLSESKNAPSDEVLFQKHQIKDLEQNGAVSVDRFLGRTKWSFVTEYVHSTKHIECNVIYLYVVNYSGVLIAYRVM